jgi:hypothetical protein
MKNNDGNTFHTPLSDPWRVEFSALFYLGLSSITKITNKESDELIDIMWH